MRIEDMEEYIEPIDTARMFNATSNELRREIINLQVKVNELIEAHNTSLFPESQEDDEDDDEERTVISPSDVIKPKKIK